MDPAQAQAILAASAEAGVTFFDTADVYGDGRSEQAIGKFLADNPGLEITVATKMGRRVEQLPENYNLANFREWTDRSRRTWAWTAGPGPAALPAHRRVQRRRGLRRAGHPGGRGRHPELRRQRRAADEALDAMRPDVRHRPDHPQCLAARAAGRRPARGGGRASGIARVPLATGLLSGRYDEDTCFPADDHRTTTAPARRSTSGRPSRASTSGRA